MSISDNILNTEYFAISKISADTDLYGIGDGSRKLFKFQKNIWNTNNQWNAGQIEIKTINNNNYTFRSATQIHTGQILAIGHKDAKLYLVDSK